MRREIAELSKLKNTEFIAFLYVVVLNEYSEFYLISNYLMISGAQSEVRGQFLKAYSDDLGVMWRDIMAPESCTEDEPESEDEPG